MVLLSVLFIIELIIMLLHPLLCWAPPNTHNPSTLARPIANSSRQATGELKQKLSLGDLAAVAQSATWRYLKIWQILGNLAVGWDKPAHPTSTRGACRQWIISDCLMSVFFLLLELLSELGLVWCQALYLFYWHFRFDSSEKLYRFRLCKHNTRCCFEHDFTCCCSWNNSYV